MRIIGLDPGLSGAAVLLDATTGEVVDKIVFSKVTEHDVADAIRGWMDGDPVRAIQEKVHSMPKQGVASSFKFGDHNGFLRGLVTALRIPYETVTPQKWQGAMKCRTGGNKNISKAAAQRRWPNEKWTHATADAALIAEYGRTQTQ